MSDSADSSTTASSPSWKGFVPCALGGLGVAAALFFLPGWSDALTPAQSIGGGIVWAFLAAAALIGSALVLLMPVIGFAGVALIFSCACGLFKYRHGGEVLKDMLGGGLALGFFCLIAFLVSAIGSATSRIVAFADPGPATASVVAFDAMSVEELGKATRTEMAWRHRKFSEEMKHGVIVERYTPATCRKIVRGYQSSPAASTYRMEVNGQEIVATTPVSVCATFDFSTIKLTKLK